MKKVSDRLEDIFKNDRKGLEEKWDNLKIFIEYGMLTEDKFYERAEKFALLKNTDDKFFSYEEYKKAIESNQTDKDKKLVYLYSTNKIDQYQYIESAKNKGYDVLLFDSQLDSHFVNLLESKFKDSSFARVDSDHIDKLIKKEDVIKPNLSDNQVFEISTAFETALPSGANYNVVVENLGINEAPIVITQSEFMRRYREMSALNGGMNFYGQMPDSYTVAVNYEHPLVQKISSELADKVSPELSTIDAQKETPKKQLEELKEKTKSLKYDEITVEQRDEMDKLEKEIEKIDNEKREKISNFSKNNDLLRQVCDLALLSNNMLKGEDLSRFIKRSISMID